MGKIGRKIFLTYFILIFVYFLVANLSFNYFSKKYIINETYKELLVEGRKLSAIMRDVPIRETIDDRIAFNTRFRIAGRLIDANLIILNPNGQVIYRDLDIKDADVISEVLESKGRLTDRYLTIRVPLKKINGELRGTIILFTELKELYEINSINRQARILSFLAASLVALVMGLFFEKSVTSPIKKLNNKIKEFSLNKKENSMESIKTGDEIEELDKSFNLLTTKLRNYDNQIKSFFQNTSHELKTPLMSIQGYAEAIRDNIVEGEEVKDSLNIIIKESQRLKETVDELILLTKLEKVEENYDFQYEDIKNILVEAIEGIRPIAEKKDIIINDKNINSYKGNFDYSKLIRAFKNILSNGIRYAEGNIYVETYKKDNTIEVHIKDDGRGFEKDEIDKVFHRFYKGKDGNTGLGLTITKAIVEAHNGLIYAKNNIPKGAHFIVELPCEK